MPRVAQLGLIERARLAVRLEHVLVRRKLPAAEPRDHFFSALWPEGVHHSTRPDKGLELGVLRRDRRVVGRELIKVLKDLRKVRVGRQR